MEGANTSMHIPEMDKYGPPIFNEPVREGMQSEVGTIDKASQLYIVLYRKGRVMNSA